MCSCVFIYVYIGIFLFCHELQNSSCSRLALSKLVCKNCKCANELDFNYCKSCGHERGRGSLEVRQSEDHLSSMKSIDERIRLLDQRLDTSSYSQQKCNLKVELELFLVSLEPSKNVYTALPGDLRKFLIFKEKHGRTKLHDQICPQKGVVGKVQCSCPTTLAAKSVDSLIGKIRAIFRDVGREGDWNPVLLTGNPAASLVMKRHLQSISLEQASYNVAKKQATPLMFDKLAMLCRYLTYQISREKDTVKKFLLLRDRAYFSLTCHSGDRGGDLNLLTSERLLELPKSEGILVSQIAGKTFSLDSPNTFILYRSKDIDICPVRHLHDYIVFSEVLRTGLDTGYLFRVSDKAGQIINKPMSSSLITDRLKMHLKAINLYEGETSHSTRRGCAITLRMMGINDEQINQHIGWGSAKMIDHYANIGKICGPGSVARKLADAAECGTRQASQLNSISEKLNSFRNLKRFAFSDLESHQS